MVRESKLVFLKDQLGKSKAPSPVIHLQGGGFPARFCLWGLATISVNKSWGVTRGKRVKSQSDEYPWFNSVGKE